MALTLSKTGIENSQTILAGHVTQSIDAFTGLSAYDITLSGSLTLTGSVKSFNGFIGNLTGTSSWASNAANATTASYALTAGSSSYALTASYVQNAQTASYVATTRTVTGAAYPSGSAYIPTVAFKFIAGGDQTGGGNTVLVTINELAGKTYGQDFFITATSGELSTPSAVSIQTPVLLPNITFISQNPYTDFTYQIMYI